jgi:hypothetical protein
LRWLEPDAAGLTFLSLSIANGEGSFHAYAARFV